MTTRPYELLARFAADGTVAGVSVRTITTVGGRDYESDPQPLNGTTDPAFSIFASRFAVVAIAERDVAVSDLSAEKTAHEVTTAALSTTTTERDSLQSQVDTIPGLQSQIATLTAELERLTALVPPPVPDAFLNADWTQFRVRIISDPAVQRVATGNSTAWPLMVLYLAQLSSTPSRGRDIAQLWSFMESQTPVTPEEVLRINAIAAECGVPLQMNEDGSIG